MLVDAADYASATFEARARRLRIALCHTSFDAFFFFFFFFFFIFLFAPDAAPRCLNATLFTPRLSPTFGMNIHHSHRKVNRSPRVSPPAQA